MFAASRVRNSVAGATNRLGVDSEPLAGNGRFSGEPAELRITEIPVDGLGVRAFVRPSTSGSVAQLVEQRTENPCVTGSIPVRATSLTRCLPNSLGFWVGTEPIAKSGLSYF